MEKMLEIGVIINSHGIKGEVKVLPLTDDPERFNFLKSVYIDDGKAVRAFDITSVKNLKDTLIVKLKGIEDRNAADAMKNSYMKIERKDAVKLPENSFFICDIMGCEVYDEKGILLGVLKDVLKTGSNDVYVVENTENKQQICLPALKSVIRNVSIEQKRMDVIVPEGLLD